MSHLNGDNVTKCTYFNEINKDELPKPNFVSSVKSLFERQIAASNNHELIQSSPGSIKQPNLNGLDRISVNTQPTSKTSLGSINSQPHSPEAVIENLVDRMKHNGTLVYDHTDCKFSST